MNNINYLKENIKRKYFIHSVLNTIDKVVENLIHKEFKKKYKIYQNIYSELKSIVKYYIRRKYISGELDKNKFNELELRALYTDRDIISENLIELIHNFTKNNYPVYHHFILYYNFELYDTTIEILLINKLDNYIRTELEKFPEKIKRRRMEPRYSRLL